MRNLILNMTAALRVQYVAVPFLLYLYRLFVVLRICIHNAARCFEINVPFCFPDLLGFAGISTSKRRVPCDCYRNSFVLG